MNSNTVNERRAFLVVLVFLGFVFAWLLKPVFIPLFLGVILTLLFYPTYCFFLRVFRGGQYVASFITTFLIFMGLVLPFTVVTTLIVNQVFDFVTHMNVRDFFSYIMSNDFYRVYLKPVMDSIKARLGINFDFVDFITKLGTELARYVYKFSPQVLIQTATFVFGFFIMHFSIFFLFMEGKKITKVVLDLSPLEAAYESRLSHELKNMIYATIYGSLFTALIQGVLAGIGFWIAGVPAPLVFGTLTFFMSLVPIVGATSVWLPMALWYFIQGNTGWGIFIACYGAFVISGIDNIVKPIIMRGHAKVHVLLIFFSLLGGIKLFGPIGILFGPVITAMFLACIRIYREDFLKANQP